MVYHPHSTDRPDSRESVGSPITQSNQFYAYLWIREKDGEFSAGTPFYIGKGCGQRAYVKHQTFNPPANKSLIVILPRSSEHEAFATEKELIRNWGRIDLQTGCLRNLTDGGEGFVGARHTEESKYRIGQAQKGNTNSLGLKCSDEHRLKVSEAKKGNKCGSGRRSEESRLNMRLARLAYLKRLSEKQNG